MKLLLADMSYLKLNRLGQPSYSLYLKADFNPKSLNTKGGYRMAEV